MRLLHEIAIFQTVKSKVIISLFETVRLSVSISLRNLYNSLNSIKEKGFPKSKSRRGSGGKRPTVSWAKLMKGRAQPSLIRKKVRTHLLLG